jgi:hypothetical protein
MSSNVLVNARDRKITQKVTVLENSLCVCVFYQYPNGITRQPSITAHYVVDGKQIVVTGITPAAYEEILTENAHGISHADGDYVAFDGNHATYRSYRERGKSHYERTYQNKNGKLVCEEIDHHTYCTAKSAIERKAGAVVVA